MHYHLFLVSKQLRWLIALEKERVHGNDAIIDPCSNHPIQNPTWVNTEIARLPLDPKTAKGASKPEKKKRKKPEEVIPKVVHFKVSKKRAKSASSSDSHQGKVSKTVDLISLVEEHFQQLLITGGNEGKNLLLKELGALSEAYRRKNLLLQHIIKRCRSSNSNCNIKALKFEHSFN
ncbi:hypothetical protein DVH24_005554 [Malus domestica]|uniref:Uncharacterized protein n=1 Tax=Malus domestica TaxID=3750 RepID=A0A498IPA1_MALDO|nr:hypothetical protein DVH24_005554 [Malus domestica]